MRHNWKPGPDDDADAEPPDYFESEGICPQCLDKEEAKKQAAANHTALQAEVKALRAENLWLKSRVGLMDQPAAPKRAAEAVVDLTADEPVEKKQKKSQSVWVLHKGDWPEEQARIVDVEVLGAFSSRVNAEAALETFCEEGEWEESGDGEYCQGDKLCNIRIEETILDE